MLQSKHVVMFVGIWVLWCACWKEDCTLSV